MEGPSYGRVLAGGIAHDFNNVLTVISASAETLRQELPAGDPLRLEAEWILSAAQKGSALTRQLLAFARRQGPAQGCIELNLLTSETLTFLSRLLGPGVQVVQRLDPAGASVKADRSQLEQVLMNLVLNARDAMPHGGTVTVSTVRLHERRWPEESRCRVQGPLVLLRVEDTGIGMEESVRRQIFTPFFTTKGPQAGTGLGLSVVQTVVKQSGGCLEVTSHPGTGTAFEVILPDAGARAAEATG
jgi:two-component system cell cycle sensor histidine kinase/response regulator CckA